MISDGNRHSRVELERRTTFVLCRTRARNACPAVEHTATARPGVEGERAADISGRLVREVVLAGAPEHRRRNASAEVTAVGEDMIDAAALEVRLPQLPADLSRRLVPFERGPLHRPVIREAGVFDAMVVGEQPVELDAPELVVVHVLVEPAPGAVGPFVDRPEVVDAVDQEAVTNQGTADRDEEVELVLPVEPAHGIVSPPTRWMLDVVRHRPASRARSIHRP